MSQFPLSPIDREIDELGAEGRIQSEEDAKSYVQALINKLGFEKKGVPRVSELKVHLTHSEYLSLRNPSKRVPEGLVADAFNQLMAEWGTPASTRINSVGEMHAFRVVMSLIINPRSASRLPDGSIATTCRPVEALYLVWLLDAQMGVSAALREKLNDPRWVAGLPQNLEIKASPVLRADAGSPNDAKERLEYLRKRSKYFSEHSIEEASTRIARILSTLDPG